VQKQNNIYVEALKFQRFGLQRGTHRIKRGGLLGVPEAGVGHSAHAVVRVVVVSATLQLK